MSQEPSIDPERDNFGAFSELIQKDPELPANLGTEENYAKNILHIT